MSRLQWMLVERGFFDRKEHSRNIAVLVEPSEFVECCHDQCSLEPMALMSNVRRQSIVSDSHIERRIRDPYRRRLHIDHHLSGRHELLQRFGHALAKSLE